MGDVEFLERQVAAWERTGNEEGAKINGLFDVDAARIKLTRQRAKADHQPVRIPALRYSCFISLEGVGVRVQGPVVVEDGPRD